MATSLSLLLAILFNGFNEGDLVEVSGGSVFWSPQSVKINDLMAV